MKLKIFNIKLLFVLTLQVCMSQGVNKELPKKYYLTELRGNISLEMEIRTWERLNFLLLLMFSFH